MSSCSGDSMVYILTGACDLSSGVSRFCHLRIVWRVTLYSLASSACGSIEFLISSLIRWVVRAWLCSAWSLDCRRKIRLEQCTQNVSGLEERPATDWYMIPRVLTRSYSKQSFRAKCAFGYRHQRIATLASARCTRRTVTHSSPTPHPTFSRIIFHRSST